MSQTVAARIPAAVDYERTLILAIEVSNKTWVLAAQVPGLLHTKAKRTIDPEAEALLAAICRISRPRRYYGLHSGRDQLPPDVRFAGKPAGTRAPPWITACPITS
jgi:hypothetical protein